MKSFKHSMVTLSLVILSLSCDKSNDVVKVYNPDTAPKAIVDRFSSTAGTLQVRTSSNGLPVAGTAVNFDEGVFITKGLGPQGQHVEYYNFDMRSTAPAPIWVLFREGETSPVTGQLNIINVLPGESGYNDFWQIIKVTVPSFYKANEVASYEEIQARRYKQEVTSMIVNCPVVPEGSTATKRLNNESTSLVRGWYKENIVFYFNFGEKELIASGGGVPTAPIYVSFVINPNTNPNSGPSSGFVTEPGTTQTHNVVAALPSSSGYSPLWVVNAFDNANFSAVTGLPSAQSATSVGRALTTVNCPIVKIAE